MITTTTKTELSHGRRKYIEDKCRCDTCRTATTNYNQWLKRQHAYGRPRRMPAAPVRDHVNNLRAAGMGLRVIARHAGVHNGVISKLLYGIPSHNRPPSQHVYTTTATKILAVTAAGNLADGARINSRPARRRLQALVAIGWSIAKLAGHLDMLPTNLARIISQDNDILVTTDRAVRNLYERLWDTPPDETTPEERGSATRSRNLAQRKGWPVPMWWDDERLDDPTPADHERPVIARQMAAKGASLAAIGRAIRADRKTVHKLLETAA